MYLCKVKPHRMNKRQLLTAMAIAAVCAAEAQADRFLARQLLTDTIAQSAGSLQEPEAMMALGDTYYGDDYATASEIYTQVDATKLTPAQKATLYYRRAYCLLKLKYYDASYALFQSLMSDEAYASQARFYQGYILYAQGKYAEALPILESSRSAEAPGDMADYYLSQIYYLKGDNDKALTTATALLSHQLIEQSYRAEAYRIAGEAAFKLGQDRKAADYLAQYLSLTNNPQPSALYILGIYAYGQGDYSEAVKLLTPATQLGDAMSQSAYLYIGQALLKEGDTDGAVLAFDKALNMELDAEVQEAAFYNYAVASLQGGRVPFGNAVGTFETFLKRYPNSQYAPQAQQYVVAAYLNNHNYRQALSSINSMARPTEATYAAKQKVLYMLGAQALGTGNATQAIDYLQQAQQLSKYDTSIAQETTLLLGEALYRDEQYAAAARQTEAYISSAGNAQGNLAVAQYDLGYIRFAQQQYEAAARAFSTMLQKPAGLSDAIQADAANRLGDCHYYLHDYSQASQAYDKAYQLNPEIGDYSLLQKGLMEGYQRHHQAKIDLLRQMQEEFPTSGLVPEALLEMTESYIQMGDNAGAIRVYQELVSAYPNTDPGRQGALQMALTMQNAGQHENAIESYRTVITNYPNSEEAGQASEQLKSLYAADGRLGDYLAFMESVPDAPAVDRAEVLYLKAVNEQEQGKDALALRTWTELEANAPTSAMTNAARIGIARCGVATEEYATALSACNALLQSSLLDDPQRIEAQYLKGMSLKGMGQSKEAQSIWREASSSLSSYFGAASAIALAQSYFDNGKIEQAEEAAKALTDSDTPYQYWVARSFILLSDIYEHQGNHFKAQQYLKSLQENYPGSEADIFQMIQARLK